MNISAYSFGNITIDGVTYTKDVIIFPDRIVSPWWRKEGHVLRVDDVTDIIDAKLPLLIVGTGYYGTMKIPDATLSQLKTNNIEVIVEHTQQAVHLFNELSSKKKVVVALHLTC